MRPSRNDANCVTTASTFLPSTVIDLACDSRVTSTRSLDLPDVPICTTWPSTPAGNNGLVTAVGLENGGRMRSTRLLSEVPAREQPAVIKQHETTAATTG